MKSKTSCFNRTIFKKNLTHYWPLWAAHLCVLLLIGPLQIWQMATAEWDMPMEPAARMYDIVHSVARGMTEPAIWFVFAGVMALAMFSYLYTAKNANMMHALPVNRLELYVTNYLSGLSFLLIPQSVVFFISLLVCLANEITCIQYLFFALLCQMGLSFFAYSLAVFVAMFTGQWLAMPIYYFVVNYLYVGCLFIVNAVMELLSYGITDCWNPGKTCILSPLYYLGNNLRVNGIYADQSGELIGIEISGMHLVAIYAAAAVVLAVLAYRIYRRRQIETAGDWVSVEVVKPVFRWGVAFYGSILLAVGITAILSSSRSINLYVSMLVISVVVGFICFFVAEMLLCKNFRVFQRKRLLEWAGFTAVIVLFLTLFEVDAFGIERALPKEEEIEKAFVNMDYPIEMEAEELPELLALHQDVIAHKKEYQELQQERSGYYYTTFLYYMKDGSMFERRYPVAVTKEAVADSDSPAAKILVWERDTENLKQYVLGKNCDGNQYVSGYIDLYNEEGEYRNYMLDEEKTSVIAEAIEKDVDAGYMTAQYLTSIMAIDEELEEEKVASCGISIDYYTNKQENDLWYYYRYYREQSRTDEWTQASNYIQFDAECVYTVEAIEKLGIVEDAWKIWSDLPEKEN